MSKEIRGSEKLKASCSSMTPLTEDELESVVGGALGSFVYRPFPRGIPWPELFNRDLGDLVIPESFGQKYV